MNNLNVGDEAICIFPAPVEIGPDGHGYQVLEPGEHIAAERVAAAEAAAEAAVVDTSFRGDRCKVLEIRPRVYLVEFKDGSVLEFSKKWIAPVPALQQLAEALED